MKAMVLALGLAAVLAAIIGLSLAAPPGGAQAQGGVAAPGNVRSADGAATGEVVVSWNAVADASFYRVGWVLMSDIDVVEADGRNWLDAFDFKDVENKGQTTQTLRGLLPGVQYAFIVGSVGQRFGVASGWSDWSYLVTAGAEACPADAGGDPQAPSGTATPTPEPGSTSTNRDYDTDDDGLIEISSLAQLDVIRHDLDGDGVSAHADHAAAFPNPAAGMGCRYRECAGYELFADLDFDTNRNGIADEGDAYWNDTYGWLPVGDPETAHRYNAVFEGNDRTIANLFIRWTDADHIGLFRATGADADIRNVRLTGVRVAGKNWVGGLVGSNGGSASGNSVTGSVSGAGGIGGLAGFNDGSISGSNSSVPVAGSGDYVGGLVGSNDGSISDSYATGAVAGEGYYVGGLVGSSGENDSSISGSYATGNVAGEGYYVGGLVGNSQGAISNSHATGSATGGSGRAGGLVGSSAGSISHSHATGSVTGEGDYVGGLAGYSTGAITASYATGSVTGVVNVGGLAGTSTDAITASYATGSVTGVSNVGGLAGSIKGTITASYATGSVTGNSYVGGLVGLIFKTYRGVTYNAYVSITASYAAGRVTSGSNAGGLVGHRSSVSRLWVTVANSYWDNQTTGQSDSAGGTGKTTREMQSPTGHTGIYASWDAEWWDFGTSRQYPALKYQGMDVAAQRQ